MAIVQGQTSGDTVATPQTTGSSYEPLFDPKTDGAADAIEIVNDGSASIIVKTERWSGRDGDPGEYVIDAGESKVVRGASTNSGPKLLGKIWVKNGSGSSAIRWAPV